MIESFGSMKREGLGWVGIHEYLDMIRYDDMGYLTAMYERFWF